ncbi:hypothetical protein ACET3X_009027 [Alternaria dauci]|uniref:Altered inheritance of mitochondria protein 24, mitochondrial n=1 Tax=Alternaria dauci TaxID=48095 RepID=A0ABR3U853_9PLEO
MSAHTPSPHRFLAPNPPSTQKLKKPQSGLHNALAVQTPASTKTVRPGPELQQKKLTPAKRFVLAPPRPATGVAKEKRGEAQEDTITHSTPLAKPRRKIERIESIEEPSQSSQSEQDENGEAIIQSIEGGHTQLGRSVEQGADQEDEMLFESVQTNKRRRISPASSPSLPQLSEPPTPAPGSNATTHRFKVLPPRTPAPFPSIAAVTSTPAAAPQRPHFILPAQPTSPQKSSRPLPEIFSPSRKHGKYIPNGLASTVTSWIIETANTGFAAQDRSGVVGGRDKEDGVRLRIRVTGLSRGGDQPQKDDAVECVSGGIVFARGSTVSGVYNASREGSMGAEDSPIRVVLAGQGGARASGGVLVKTGCLFIAALRNIDIPNTLHGSWVVLSIPDLGHKILNAVGKFFFGETIAFVKASDAACNRRTNMLDQGQHALRKKTIGLIVGYFFVGSHFGIGALTPAMTLSLGHAHANYSLRQYFDG